MFREEESGGQVHRQHAVPLLQRQGGDWLVDSDAGVIDEDVHAPRLCHHLRDEIDDAALARQVDLVGPHRLADRLGRKAQAEVLIEGIEGLLRPAGDGL